MGEIFLKVLMPRLNSTYCNLFILERGLAINVFKSTLDDFTLQPRIQNWGFGGLPLYTFAAQVAKKNSIVKQFGSGALLWLWECLWPKPSQKGKVKVIWQNRLYWSSRIQFEPSPRKKSPKFLKFLLKPLVHLFRNHFNTHVPVINVSCTVLPEIFLIIRFYYLVYVLNRFVKLCIFKALANWRQFLPLHNWNNSQVNNLDKVFGIPGGNWNIMRLYLYVFLMYNYWYTIISLVKYSINETNFSLCPLFYIATFSWLDSLVILNLNNSLMFFMSKTNVLFFSSTCRLCNGLCKMVYSWIGAF